MAQEKPKSIYALEMHETVFINPELTVQRVPGGWNYKYYNYQPYAISEYNPHWEWLLISVVFVAYVNDQKD